MQRGAWTSASSTAAQKTIMRWAVNSQLLALGASTYAVTDIRDRLSHRVCDHRSERFLRTSPRRHIGRNEVLAYPLRGLSQYLLDDENDVLAH